MQAKCAQYTSYQLGGTDSVSYLVVSLMISYNTIDRKATPSADSQMARFRTIIARTHRQGGDPTQGIYSGLNVLPHNKLLLDCYWSHFCTYKYFVYLGLGPYLPLVSSYLPVANMPSKMNTIGHCIAPHFFNTLFLQNFYKFIC